MLIRLLLMCSIDCFSHTSPDVLIRRKSGRRCGKSPFNYLSLELANFLRDSINVSRWENLCATAAKYATLFQLLTGDDCQRKGDGRWGGMGGGRVRALWVVASSDELNNKRCKYDNFSQDVASNNKIKIIPRQRQKSPSFSLAEKVG